MRAKEGEAVTDTLEAAPGRVAVITGGGTGVGRETAAQLAELGWSVAVGGRRSRHLDQTARAVEAAGGQCLPTQLDVTDPGSVERFFGEVERQLGTATVVVNNAAVANHSSLYESSTGDIAAEVATKLIGALYVSRRAIQGMLRAGRGGDIAFVSSMAAVAPWPLHVPYAAACAGIEHAAQSLRLELEGTGIRISTIRCGNTATDIAPQQAADEARELAIRERWFGLGLLRHGNLLEPADVAAAIVSAVTLPIGREYGVLEVTPAAPKAALPQNFPQWRAAVAATVVARQAMRTADIETADTL
jgi:NAD(P)-dependent dehydrogenase (short-subunit alcohol dehydrogenase family)